MAEHRFLISKRECIRCEQEFPLTSGNQKYCSSKCRDADKRDRYRITAPQSRSVVCGNLDCGKPFSTRNANHKYCSRPCYIKMRNFKQGLRLATPKYHILTGWWHVIRSARVRGIELSITRDEYMDIIRSGKCIYCNDDLPQYGGGVDRVDSSLGYVPGNCVPSCGPCNKLKGKDQISHDEMFHVVRLLRQLRTKNFLLGVA